MLVALNMSAKPQTLAYELEPVGIRGKIGTVLLATGTNGPTVPLSGVELPAFGVVVLGVD